MIWAFFGALGVGLSLGLLGSGGSILTVPILVYVVGQPEKIAIAGSLAIVGVIALAGALPWALRGQVAWRQVAFFGAPGIAGTFLGATLARFLTGHAQMTIFGAAMLVAAVMTLRRGAASAEAPRERHQLLLILQGMGIGMLTGIVGVGGGFLILPALIVLGGLTMHRALATSLSIIALNSAAGFVRHAALLAAAGLVLNWHVIGVFAAVGMAGSLAGQRVACHLPQQRLQQTFGALLLVMGVFVLWNSVRPLAASF